MNIDIEKLIVIISDFVTNEGYDIYSDESAERLNAFEERINKTPCLSKRFKAQFSNELTISIECVALDSFENGLRIGFGMLKNLFGIENPELHITTKKTESKAERYTPEYPPNFEFKEYMKWADNYLSDIEKGRIMSETEAFIEENREKTFNLF